MFNIDENDNSDFNILTLILICEKLKKESSLWHPYF